MKRYGANFTTEFTKKQISVVYGLAKSGELKVEKWFVGKLYDAAEYYGYDANRSMARFEQRVLNILESVFSGDYGAAQKNIDDATEESFSLYSQKAQSTFDRAYIG